MDAKTRQEYQNGQRIFARVFTIIGGIFWITTAFAGPYVFGGETLMGAFGVAIFPLIFTLGMLTIGWFYERLAAGILALGALGTVAWGAIMGWELAVWMIMVMFFVAPTITASVLFYLAGDRPSEQPIMPTAHAGANEKPDNVVEADTRRKIAA